MKTFPMRGTVTTVNIADLFCGAGGTSTGAVEAIKILGKRPRLTAINHWPVAIKTHTENHPDARHLTTAIDNVNPRSLYKEGELDVLWASPECTHHSVARGARPINDQSRATAWCVVRWAGDLRPAIILVENVPEFMTWGGIGTNGRPLKNQKGKTYLAWKAALESLGYRVDQKVLCAADYGDPTTRRRLFVMAVRGRRQIAWPEPTHCDPKLMDDEPQFGFENRLKAWIPARDIIDWKIEGQSIYSRKRPLSPKTMRRIFAGLRKFGLKPFIVPQTNPASEAGRDVDRPAPTVTTTSRGVGVATPFIVTAGGPEGQGRTAHSVDKPLGTVIAEDRRALVEPMIISAGGPACPARPVSEPVGTILTRDHRALVEPFLVVNKGTSNAADIDKPTPAITAHAAHIAIAEPCLIKLRGGEETHFDNSSAKSLDEPVPAVCANGNHIGLAEFLIPNFGEREGQEPRCHSVDEPLPAVTSHGAGGLVTSKLVPPQRRNHAVAEPFLIQVAHGESKSEKNPERRRVKSIHDPLPTVHAGGRGFAICQPVLKDTDASRAKSIHEPMPTVCGNRGDMALVESALLPQHGGGQGDVALVRWGVRIAGETYLLDIRFRMLQPHELAAAQGFRRDYKFSGNKSEQVKQIGNAVPRGLARALFLSAYTQRSDISQFLTQALAA